ncbi:MAG: HDOD domain-containing protein [Opitutaceae bacterium]
MQTTSAALDRDLLSPEDIVRDLGHLPSSPKVLPRLLDVLRDDRASLDDVVSLIRVDAGMAARVLQIGGSAYYTTSQAARCVTMEDAVHRVGLVKVYELVAYAATSQLLMRTLRAYGLDPDAVWQMSVTGALAAERLASRIGGDFQHAYTIGLLHGVGLIAIDAWLTAGESSIEFGWSGLPEETTAAEKKNLGFNNAAVAAALLRAWGFPSQITEPVRWQYAPAFASGHRRMASILHAAKWLRDAVHTPPDRALPPAPEKAVLDLIPFEAADLEVLIDEVKDGVLRASLLLAEPEDDGSPSMF